MGDDLQFRHKKSNMGNYYEDNSDDLQLIHKNDKFKKNSVTEKEKQWFSDKAIIKVNRPISTNNPLDINAITGSIANSVVSGLRKEDQEQFRPYLQRTAKLNQFNNADKNKFVSYMDSKSDKISKIVGSDPTKFDNDILNYLKKNPDDEEVADFYKSYNSDDGNWDETMHPDNYFTSKENKTHFLNMVYHKKHKQQNVQNSGVSGAIKNIQQTAQNISSNITNKNIQQPADKEKSAIETLYGVVQTAIPELKNTKFDDIPNHALKALKEGRDLYNKDYMNSLSPKEKDYMIELSKNPHKQNSKEWIKYNDIARDKFMKNLENVMDKDEYDNLIKTKESIKEQIKELEAEFNNSRSMLSFMPVYFDTMNYAEIAPEEFRKFKSERTGKTLIDYEKELEKIEKAEYIDQYYILNDKIRQFQEHYFDIKDGKISCKDPKAIDGLINTILTEGSLHVGRKKWDRSNFTNYFGETSGIAKQIGESLAPETWYEGLAKYSGPAGLGITTLLDFKYKDVLPHEMQDFLGVSDFEPGELEYYNYINTKITELKQIQSHLNNFGKIDFSKKDTGVSGVIRDIGSSLFRGATDWADDKMKRLWYGNNIIDKDIVFSNNIDTNIDAANYLNLARYSNADILQSTQGLLYNMAENNVISPEELNSIIEEGDWKRTAVLFGDRIGDMIPDLIVGGFKIGTKAGEMVGSRILNTAEKLREQNNIKKTLSYIDEFNAIDDVPHIVNFRKKMGMFLNPKGYFQSLKGRNAEEGIEIASAWEMANPILSTSRISGGMLGAMLFRMDPNMTIEEAIETTKSGIMFGALTSALGTYFTNGARSLSLQSKNINNLSRINKINGISEYQAAINKNMITLNTVGNTLGGITGTTGIGKVIENWFTGEEAPPDFNNEVFLELATNLVFSTQEAMHTAKYGSGLKKIKKIRDIQHVKHEKKLLDNINIDETSNIVSIISDIETNKRSGAQWEGDKYAIVETVETGEQIMRRYANKENGEQITVGDLLHIKKLVKGKKNWPVKKRAKEFLDNLIENNKDMPIDFKDIGDKHAGQIDAETGRITINTRLFDPYNMDPLMSESNAVDRIIYVMSHELGHKPLMDAFNSGDTETITKLSKIYNDFVEMYYNNDGEGIALKMNSNKLNYVLKSMMNENGKIPYYNVESPTNEQRLVLEEFFAQVNDLSIPVFHKYLNRMGMRYKNNSIGSVMNNMRNYILEKTGASEYVRNYTKSVNDALLASYEPNRIQNTEVLEHIDNSIRNMNMNFITDSYNKIEFNESVKEQIGRAVKNYYKTASMEKKLEKLNKPVTMFIDDFINKYGEDITKSPVFGKELIKYIKNETDLLRQPGQNNQAYNIQDILRDLDENDRIDTETDYNDINYTQKYKSTDPHIKELHQRLGIENTSDFKERFIGKKSEEIFEDVHNLLQEKYSEEMNADKLFNYANILSLELSNMKTAEPIHLDINLNGEASATLYINDNAADFTQTDNVIVEPVYSKNYWETRTKYFDNKNWNQNYRNAISHFNEAKYSKVVSSKTSYTNDSNNLKTKRGHGLTVDMLKNNDTKLSLFEKGYFIPPKESGSLMFKMPKSFKAMLATNTPEQLLKISKSIFHSNFKRFLLSDNVWNGLSDGKDLMNRIKNEYGVMNFDELYKGIKSEEMDYTKLFPKADSDIINKNKDNIDSMIMPFIEKGKKYYDDCDDHPLNWDVEELKKDGDKELRKQAIKALHAAYNDTWHWSLDNSGQSRMYNDKGSQRETGKLFEKYMNVHMGNSARRMASGKIFETFIEGFAKVDDVQEYLQGKNIVKEGDDYFINSMLYNPIMFERAGLLKGHFDKDPTDGGAYVFDDITEVLDAINGEESGVISMYKPKGYIIDNNNNTVMLKGAFHRLDKNKFTDNWSREFPEFLDKFKSQISLMIPNTMTKSGNSFTTNVKEIPELNIKVGINNAGEILWTSKDGIKKDTNKEMIDGVYDYAIEKLQQGIVPDFMKLKIPLTGNNAIMFDTPSHPLAKPTKLAFGIMDIPYTVSENGFFQGETGMAAREAINNLKNNLVNKYYKNIKTITSLRNIFREGKYNVSESINKEIGTFINDIFTDYITNADDMTLSKVTKLNKSSALNLLKSSVLDGQFQHESFPKLLMYFPDLFASKPQGKYNPGAGHNTTLADMVANEIDNCLKMRTTGATLNLTIENNTKANILNGAHYSYHSLVENNKRLSDETKSKSLKYYSRLAQSLLNEYIDPNTGLLKDYSNGIIVSTDYLDVMNKERFNKGLKPLQIGSRVLGVRTPVDGPDSMGAFMIVGVSEKKGTVQINHKMGIEVFGTDYDKDGFGLKADDTELVEKDFNAIYDYWLNSGVNKGILKSDAKLMAQEEKEFNGTNYTFPSKYGLKEEKYDYKPQQLNHYDAAVGALTGKSAAISRRTLIARAFENLGKNEYDIISGPYKIKLKINNEWTEKNGVKYNIFSSLSNYITQKSVDINNQKNIAPDNAMYDMIIDKVEINRPSEEQSANMNIDYMNNPSLYGRVHAAIQKELTRIAEFDVGKAEKYTNRNSLMYDAMFESRHKDSYPNNINSLLYDKVNNDYSNIFLGGDKKPYSTEMLRHNINGEINKSIIDIKDERWIDTKLLTADDINNIDIVKNKINRLYWFISDRTKSKLWRSGKKDDTYAEKRDIFDEFKAVKASKENKFKGVYQTNDPFDIGLADMITRYYTKNGYLTDKDIIRQLKNGDLIKFDKDSGLLKHIVNNEVVHKTRINKIYDANGKRLEWIPDEFILSNDQPGRILGDIFDKKMPPMSKDNQIEDMVCDMIDHAMKTKYSGNISESKKAAIVSYMALSGLKGNHGFSSTMLGSGYNKGMLINPLMNFNINKHVQETKYKNDINKIAQVAKNHKERKEAYIEQRKKDFMDTSEEGAIFDSDVFMENETAGLISTMAIKLNNKGYKLYVPSEKGMSNIHSVINNISKNYGNMLQNSEITVNKNYMPMRNIIPERELSINKKSINKQMGILLKTGKESGFKNELYKMNKDEFFRWTNEILKNYSVIPAFKNIAKKSGFEKNSPEYNEVMDQVNVFMRGFVGNHYEAMHKYFTNSLTGDRYVNPQSVVFALQTLKNIQAQPIYNKFFQYAGYHSRRANMVIDAASDVRDKDNYNSMYEIMKLYDVTNKGHTNSRTSYNIGDIIETNTSTQSPYHFMNKNQINYIIPHNYIMDTKDAVFGALAKASDHFNKNRNKYNSLNMTIKNGVDIIDNKYQELRDIIDFQTEFSRGKPLTGKIIIKNAIDNEMAGNSAYDALLKKDLSENDITDQNIKDFVESTIKAYETVHGGIKEKYDNDSINEFASAFKAYAVLKLNFSKAADTMMSMASMIADKYDKCTDEYNRGHILTSIKELKKFSKLFYEADSKTMRNMSREFYNKKGNIDVLSELIGGYNEDMQNVAGQEMNENSIFYNKEAHDKALHIASAKMAKFKGYVIGTNERDPNPVIMYGKSMYNKGMDRNDIIFNMAKMLNMGNNKKKLSELKLTPAKMAIKMYSAIANHDMIANTHGGYMYNILNSIGAKGFERPYHTLDNVDKREFESLANNIVKDKIDNIMDYQTKLQTYQQGNKSKIYWHHTDMAKADKFFEFKKEDDFAYNIDAYDIFEHYIERKEGNEEINTDEMFRYDNVIINNKVEQMFKQALMPYETAMRNEYLKNPDKNEISHQVILGELSTIAGKETLFNKRIDPQVFHDVLDKIPENNKKIAVMNELRPGTDINLSYIHGDNIVDYTNSKQMKGPKMFNMTGKILGLLQPEIKDMTTYDMNPYSDAEFKTANPLPNERYIAMLGTGSNSNKLYVINIDHVVDLYSGTPYSKIDKSIAKHTNKVMNKHASSLLTELHDNADFKNTEYTKHLRELLGELPEQFSFKNKETNEYKTVYNNSRTIKNNATKLHKEIIQIKTDNKKGLANKLKKFHKFYNKMQAWEVYQGGKNVIELLAGAAITPFEPNIGTNLMVDAAGKIVGRNIKIVTQNIVGVTGDVLRKGTFEDIVDTFNTIINLGGGSNKESTGLQKTYALQKGHGNRMTEFNDIINNIMDHDVFSLDKRGWKAFGNLFKTKGIVGKFEKYAEELSELERTHFADWSVEMNDTFKKLGKKIGLSMVSTKNNNVFAINGYTQKEAQKAAINIFDIVNNIMTLNGIYSRIEGLSTCKAYQDMEKVADNKLNNIKTAMSEMGESVNKDYHLMFFENMLDEGVKKSIGDYTRTSLHNSNLSRTLTMFDNFRRERNIDQSKYLYQRNQIINAVLQDIRTDKQVLDIFKKNKITMPLGDSFITSAKKEMIKTFAGSASLSILGLGYASISLLPIIFDSKAAYSITNSKYSDTANDILSPPFEYYAQALEVLKDIALYMTAEPETKKDGSIKSAYAKKEETYLNKLTSNLSDAIPPLSGMAMDNLKDIMYKTLFIKTVTEMKVHGDDAKNYFEKSLNESILSMVPLGKTAQQIMKDYEKYEEKPKKEKTKKITNKRLFK